LGGLSIASLILCKAPENEKWMVEKSGLGIETAVQLNKINMLGRKNIFCDKNLHTVQETRLLISTGVC
jgi:hypothetical protein